MKKIIIYGSYYGTTKSYAEKLSDMTGLPVINYKDIKELNTYDEVIHLGGLYAGGVKGLKNTIKLLPERANLIFVTVGLGDVTQKVNTDNIKKSIYKQVTKSVLDRTKIVHLRGGIDYGQLSFIHKTMMSMVYKKAKNTPEEQITEEDRALIETYGQNVDFTDFDTLQKVIEVI